MIEIKNWYVRVPNEEYLIGYSGEHLVHKLEFLQPDKGYADWTFKLDVKQNGNKDALALDVMEIPEGLLLSTDVRRGLLTRPGSITAQIRAFHLDGRERHTNQFYFAARDSVKPWEGFPDPLPTEFHQMEQTMSAILQEAQEAALRAENAVGQTDLVRQYKSYLEFPSLGGPKILYMDTTMNKAYRWDEDEKKYFVVGSDYEQIKVIDGGKANG